jgi:hypothetical protein
MDPLNERMQSDRSDLKRTATLAARIAGLASDGKRRFSKSRRESLVLLKGIGVDGDAHAGPFVRHRYLARRKAAMPNARQVHLIPVELLEALRGRTAFSAPATSARTC